METVIIVDSCCDLPIEFIEENNIPVLGLTYNIDGIDYIDDMGRTMSYQEFYSKVRQGAMPTTSQVNVHRFYEEFKKHVSNNKSVIYIGFSSALSGCISSANTAKDMIKEEYTDCDITIVDTKRATMGYGLLVMKAFELLNNGASKEEIVLWLENNKLKVVEVFTLDDLFHLRRGGRLSGSSALVGTLLNIKPILYIDDEGRLIPTAKAKGRKKSLNMLIEMAREQISDPGNQTIGISHSDCYDDALYLKNAMLKDIGVKDVIITYVGTVIGSHTGVGGVGIFFFKK